MIELSIAISILMIGMVALVSATSRMHGLRRQNHHRSLAQNAVRSVVERIHARSHLHSSDPTTWATNMVAEFGPASANATFEVVGLTEADGVAVPGSVHLIIDETLTDAGLDAELGMPRDLDGDGVANNPDVSNSARMLPVIVALRWRSQSGESLYRHAFYVMGY